MRLDLAGRAHARAADFQADLSFSPGRPAADYSLVRGMPGLADEEPIRHSASPR